MLHMNPEKFEIKIDAAHKEIARKAREFAEREVEPVSREIHEKGVISRSLLRKAGEQGFFGICIPRELSGVGSDLLGLALMIEELSKASTSFALAILVPYLFTIPLMTFGSQQQKSKYVPKIASGKLYAAHAATEPTSGSDLAGIKTNAKRRGAEWILDGVKSFVSGAEWADYFLVLARVPDFGEDPRKQLTFFIVDREADGLDIGISDDLIGVRGIRIGYLELRGVRVPDENRVGAVGEGLKVASETYGRTRVGAAALALGAMQALLNQTINYAVKRKAFGRSIASFQATKFKLVDIFADLINVKLLVYWSARTLDESPEKLEAASLAKLRAAEMLEKAAIKAIEIHGGVGVIKKTMVERFLLDSQILKMIEGTPEIQRIIISRYLAKNLDDEAEKD